MVRPRCGARTSPPWDPGPRELRAANPPMSVAWCKSWWPSSNQFVASPSANYGQRIAETSSHGRLSFLAPQESHQGTIRPRRGPHRAVSSRGFGAHLRAPTRPARWRTPSVDCPGPGLSGCATSRRPAHCPGPVSRKSSAGWSLTARNPVRRSGPGAGRPESRNPSTVGRLGGPLPRGGALDPEVGGVGSRRIVGCLGR